MTSYFSKLTTPDGSTVECEGGGSPPYVAAYRQNTNFAQGRNGRYNKNQLQNGRCIKLFIVLANIFINCWMVRNNYGIYESWWQVAMNVVGYYSLWGSTFAFISLVFSIMACNYDGWFKTAYITTEISFSVNTCIFLMFWLLLYPALLLGGALKTAPEKWYQGLLHAVPWLTTVSELAMTDMALEKSHWWIMFLVMCPCYMLCNLIGAKTLPHLVAQFPQGSVYGLEAWNTRPMFTICVFLVLALIQSAIYYCACAIVERCWPKREEEHFADKVETLLN